ncbi:Riboflavin biosynthesis protein ribF (Includes: Riboflavin kinase; FMN adenylyltransferase) (fragment) [Nostocoides japonicum T1-X7]|uniref:riboflavin kinase n=1 Tax=Nostocoides japonicum T1-X7 TaxID=1194083 RepID=A0A077M266_9MICO
MAGDGASVIAHVEGIVVAGAQRGRTLGYPTANLTVLSTRDLPQDGVYFGWFSLVDAPSATGHLDPDIPWPVLVSIGTNPTFDNAERTVEAHLFDFDDDLYGRRAVINLERQLRPQRRFDSIEALTAHIETIARDGRQLLESLGWTAPGR